MRDRFDRPINSLRISVTRKCNLKCFYCHKEGQEKDGEEMSVEEIGRLVGVASKLGIKKVKITGGEPLLRHDIIDIIRSISPVSDEISMTTNGITLASKAEGLKEAGLARVNISLHSIRPRTYEKIVGLDRLDQVQEGIETAIETGLTPLKVNMVYLRGYNEDELPDMLAYASRVGALLQVIEYEASKEDMQNRTFIEHHGDLERFEEALMSSALSLGVNPLHRRRRFRIESMPVEEWKDRSLAGSVDVEIVRPMHNSSFCGNCTRIRLTASGHIKGCLFDKRTLDALGPLRDGATDAELGDLFKKVIMERRPYWSEGDEGSPST